MEKQSRIFVAGHRGLAGSAVVRELKRQGYNNLIVRTHAQCDLSDARAVENLFSEEAPEYVCLAAARVGGILANRDKPVQFLLENLRLQESVIEACFRHKVKRLLFLGSSCIYPRECPQPIREEYLLSGPLELTNRSYALAKIAGVELCWGFNRQYGTRFLTLMPCNLYGPGDNLDLETSHVVPALIRKTCEAQFRRDSEIEVWGTGRPLREFLYIDDFAEACVFAMNLDDRKANLLLGEERPPLLNVGSGEEISVGNLATMIAEEVGFTGGIRFDPSRPDGTLRKILDSKFMRTLGWTPKTSLRDGIRATIKAARSQIEAGLPIQHPDVSRSMQPQLEETAAQDSL
jgi:GDP-L-fucose synthase